MSLEKRRWGLVRLVFTVVLVSIPNRSLLEYCWKRFQIFRIRFAKLSCFSNKASILFLLNLNFSKPCSTETVHCQITNVPHNCGPPKMSEGFFTYASLYFTMFFIFFEVSVMVYFVLLKHFFHQVKHDVAVMNMVVTSRWIRIAQ